MSMATLSQPAIDVRTQMRLDEGGGPSPASSLTGELARPREGDDTVPSRRCGRCREVFPGDPTCHPTALPEWWLCPPCRLALLGNRRSHPSAGAASHAPVGVHRAR